MGVYLLRGNDDAICQSVTYNPVVASEYGYGYSFPAGNSVPTGYYEGHAVFYAKKKTVNSTKGISITYVHDNSRLIKVSYGLNIGIASVSVSSGSSSLQVYSNNFLFKAI